MTLHEVTSNLDEIRNHDGSGRISPSAATVKHLRSDLVSSEEDRIVHALHPGQHRMAAHHPWPHRYFDPGFRVLRRTNKADGAVETIYSTNISCTNLADTTSGNPRYVQSSPESHSRKNAEFVAAVHAVDVQ